MIPEYIARLIAEAVAHNTLSTRTVPIYFQRFPGVEVTADDRGIQDLEYQVVSGGTVVQTGRTPANGLITCQVRPGGSTLQLMFGGAVVSEYTVTINDLALDAVTSVRGRQQRLMMLGYDVGARGIDGLMGGETEKALLNFQADKGFPLSGTIGTTEQNGLTTDANE